MKRLYKLFALVLVLAALLVPLAGCQNSDADAQVVNILSANYEEQIAIQLEYLRSLYPDAEINITYMSSGKLAAQLQAEGRDTDTDIALSLSSAYANTLKNEGLLRAYEPSSSYKSEYADPDNMVLPNGVWCGAILVNTQELEKLGLPEPDLVLWMDMPVEQAGKNLRSREAETHTKGDIHEVDPDYLAACRDSALQAARLLGWQVIPCVTGDGRLRTVEEIHREVWSLVSPLLNLN